MVYLSDIERNCKIVGLRATELDAQFVSNIDVAELCPARLRHLAKEIHRLGPRPLFELLDEIIAGAEPKECVERYARLSLEYGDFIVALGGDRFPQQHDLFVIDGNDLIHPQSVTPSTGGANDIAH